ncbi:MAG: hypothetical protein OEZ34_17335 [Spirochaetia bacterium]|nr:hypothetical protein [Spirochaetia bacterium]
MYVKFTARFTEEVEQGGGENAPAGQREKGAGNCQQIQNPF